MTWDIDLAKQFKQRNNNTPIGAVIGQVISIEPFKVSLFEGKIILDNAYKCVNCIVEIGDSVLCIADSTGQTFYIVDRVVR